MTNSATSPWDAELIARLLRPEGRELTYEECFEALDRYFELTLADERLPGMREHLRGCPA